MLSDLELEQLIFCLTNMGPRISLNDLDVEPKTQLKLGLRWGAGCGIDMLEGWHLALSFPWHGEVVWGVLCCWLPFCSC